MSAVLSAVLGIQPVLFLGEIVVSDAGAVQGAQSRLRGAEIGGVAMGFGDVQRHAVDPAAHQGFLTGKQQRRCDAERTGNRERAAFATEQRAG